MWGRGRRVRSKLVCFFASYRCALPQLGSWKCMIRPLRTHRTVITRPTTTAAMVGHHVEKGSARSKRSSRRSMVVLLSQLMHEFEKSLCSLLCTARDLGLNCNRSNNKYKFLLRAPTAAARPLLGFPWRQLNLNGLPRSVPFRSIPFRSASLRSVPAYFQFT